MGTFESLFRKATGLPDPYPYQKTLASGSWPDALNVPTGLGKTAGVGLSWIHKRREGDPETPRRLVYCLPMRVLADQTADQFRSWLGRLDLLGASGEGRTSVHLLMGGEDDIRSAHWARHPEEDAVLIGTQDMLLSRALMRGYGMSRYQWPVHFALLHTDALWVFDEIQLMGPGLATSAQLDAFRRRMPVDGPTRSLWVSATLHRDWLATVDFREHLTSLSVLGIGEEDRRKAEERLQATKRLHRSPLSLDSDTAKGQAAAYLARLADHVMGRHVEGHQTLVVLNRVDRAQGLARLLRERVREVPVLLVHGRFREKERRELDARLRAGLPEEGRIVVATQAVEAGVDLTSRLLVTELAPWSSMVQRFGRCNRYGECSRGADIHWVDITDEKQAPPYEDEDLVKARSVLGGLDVAGPDDLPPVAPDRPLGQVLRWKDFAELFDTDPDLSGFDVNVAPYIRDQDTPGVQVFWRSFEGNPSPDQPRPDRSELCSVSMAQWDRYLKKKREGRTRPCWVWDPLGERWEHRGRNDRPVPGSVLLLRAQHGGYDADLGFLPDHLGEVAVVARGQEGPPHESYPGEDATRTGRFVSLNEHTADVVRGVRGLAGALNLDPGAEEVLETAALWHDTGKAHPAFQTALLDEPEGRQAGPGPWAKSSGGGRLAYRIERDGGTERRSHFRHELVSMLVWLAHRGAQEDGDLVAFLIAAHHGKVRMGLRALPGESAPPDGRLFARGIWDGDEVPALSLNGAEIPATRVRLDVMHLGLGEGGPSWTERTQRLLAQHGPFRLAWLEALLRIADWRASALGEGDE